MAWLQNKWMGWIGSGALLGLPFLVEPLWWVGFVGAAWFLTLALSVDRLRFALIGGWCAWFVKALCAVLWFWSVYPIEWLGYDLGRVQIGFIAYGWIISAIGLAVGGVVVTAIIWLLNRFEVRRTILLGLFPFLWVVAEVVGAFSFSLITLGEGGIVTSAFSFGMTGYLLGGHPWLIMPATWLGVYGLSALFASLTVFFWWYLYQQRRVLLVGSFSLLLLVSFFIPIPVQNPSEATVRIATIDTQFPVIFAAMAENEQFMRGELTRAVKEALKSNPDYVLLPEDASLFPGPVTIENANNFIRQEFGSTSATIIDSQDVLVKNSRVLRSYIYEGKTGRIFVADKQYLVPQGEFLPVSTSLFLRVLGYGDLVSEIGQNIAYRPGPIASQKDFPEDFPAILFCVESVNPFGVKRLIEERPDVPFVAHPISHGWFHSPHVLWFNLDRMLRVQTLWNDTTVVSAGSHVTGRVYRSDGTVSEPELSRKDEYWSVHIVELE